MNFSWLADLWNQSPRSLKKVLASMLLVFAVVFAIVIGVHVWTAGWIQEKLGFVATRNDLQAQAATINQNARQVADQVTTALAAYDDSLKSYLGQERKLAVDTTLKPLVKMMFAMSRQIEELQTVQRTTQSQVRQLPAAYDASLRAIIDEQPPNRTDAMLEELLRAQADQQAFNARMDSLMRSKRKNNKVGL
jgi:hypothetical protein